MDVSTILAISGVTIGLLSGGATFFNKQRFVAQNALLQAGNDELRNQNKDLRDERVDHVAQLAACKARDEEKERLIANYKRQPNFNQLVKLITSNHKEVMMALGKKMK
jgi:hypothetical protein